MKLKVSFSRGFTLVELMIVIAIIGILAAVLYPGLMGYFEGARDTARMGALKNYTLALNGFNTATTTFPNGNTLDNPSNSDTDQSTPLCIKDLYENYLKGQYITTFDKDPKGSQTVDVGAATTCGKEQGGFGYRSLQSSDGAADYGNGFVLAARVEKWDNANFDGGATNGENVKAIVATQGLDTLQKGSTESLDMKNKEAIQWYYIKFQ